MRNIKHCRSSTLNTVNTFGCITYSSSLSTVQVPSILTLSGLPTGRGQTDLESCDSSIYILHIPSQWCHTTRYTTITTVMSAYGDETDQRWAIITPALYFWETSSFVILVATRPGLTRGDNLYNSDLPLTTAHLQWHPPLTLPLWHCHDHEPPLVINKNITQTTLHCTLANGSKL